MRIIKISILIMTLLTLIWTNIQAQKIEGEYPYNNKKLTGKANFIVRKDGSLKAELNYLNPAKVVPFYKVANQENIYEGDPESRSRILRITAKNEQVFIMHVLSSRRFIEDVIIFSKDKKLIKPIEEEMGLAPKKLTLKEKMAKLKGNEEKKPMTVKDLKFVAFNPTSKFHEENVGKMVFFGERPIIGQEDPSKVKTSFKIGEPIWAALYLPTTIEQASSAYSGIVNEYQDPNTGKLHYYLDLRIDKVDEDLLEDEKEVCWNYSVHKLPLGADDDKSCYVFQVLPGLNDFNMYRSDATRVTNSFAENLGAYKHTLRATLNGKSIESKIFIGEFEYDASAGKEALEEYAQKIKNAALEDKELPNPAMKDPKIEGEMIQQANLYASNRGWSGKCVKAIIASNWQVLTKPDGTIRGKYIQGHCVFNDEKGEDCSYINFGFLKEYQGGGQYSDAIRQYDIGFRGAISCDKAK